MRASSKQPEQIGQTEQQQVEEAEQNTAEQNTAEQNTAERNTAARLTPLGRGGVATIAVVGNLQLLDGIQDSASLPKILFQAVNQKQIAEQKINAIVYGYWKKEDVVITKQSSSRLEIHCHGGEVAVQKILNDLQQSGFQTVLWQEQIEGIYQRECEIALARCTTLRTAAYLSNQMNNQVARKEIDRLQTSLQDQNANWKAIRKTVQNWLDSYSFGHHLTQPWRVVLMGEPNVGKSSLINRLIGYERTIVHNQPGTTRDAIMAQTALDGFPVSLTDTAGLRETEDAVEQAGVRKTLQNVDDADLVLFIIDRSEVPSKNVLEKLKNRPENAMIIANKVDLQNAWSDQLPKNTFAISAASNEGVENLMTAIVAYLVPQIPSTESLFLFTPRQHALMQSVLLEVDNKNATAACNLLEQFFQSGYHSEHHEIS